MIYKTKRFLPIIVFVFIFLTSCGAAIVPGPTITDIVSNPKLIEEGSSISYTITYENKHPTDTFYDVTLSARFLDVVDLVASNPPVQITSKDGYLYATWSIGTLKPGDIGSLIVKFNVDAQIPPNIYEIQISGSIKGNDINKTPVANSGQTIQYIKGRFTPTSAPTKTRTPNSENLTQTATMLVKPSKTLLPSRTPSATLTLTSTSTATHLPSDTPSPSETPTATNTLTPFPTSTLTPTPTVTPTPESNSVDSDVTIAVISVIGVIVSGAIAAYATIQAAKIQTKRKR